ncbi:hypothetical protein MTO96_028859 [Rhipicephalus appendiculatus]
MPQEREYEEAEEEERIAAMSDEEMLDGETAPPAESSLLSAEEGTTSDDIFVSLQETIRDEKAEKLKQARIFMPEHKTCTSYVAMLEPSCHATQFSIDHVTAREYRMLKEKLAAIEEVSAGVKMTELALKSPRVLWQPF